MPRDLSPEQEARLKRVRGAFDSADQTVHKRCRDRWDELYRLFRSYQGFKQFVREERGRDVVMAEGRAEFGEDLFIPYSFSTVETIVPRMLSNRPRGVILPRDDRAVRNGEGMRFLLDAQQEQARYPLTCQTTAKTGQIYGLGVQKDGWRRVERKKNYLVPATPGAAHGMEWAQECEQRRVYDDNHAEDVDIFDFLWDPYGDCLENCEWVIHRTWRPLRYVLARLGLGPDGMPEAGADWDLAPELSRDDVQAMGSPEKFGEVWRERMNARGYENFGTEMRGQQRHEVWEFHDGHKIITVLDREIPVREIENPSWHGDMPFSIYRPSEVPHELPGIGAIEPARDLQYEMNVSRSQRRDHEALALSPVYAYQDGAIDPAHLRIAPGMLWPVLGEPSDLLKKVELGDVPQSAYMAEDRVRADIERTTGLSDLVQGAAQTGSGTATEAQLQLASANVRIQNMTLRFEAEIIESVMNRWIENNQQHIVEARGVPVQGPVPGEPDRRWGWFVEMMGPGELAGLMKYRALGGSTAPDNVPQQRSDAQALSGLRGDPNVDQRKLMELILEKNGVRDPEGLLAEGNRIPPGTLEVAAQMVAERTGAPPEEAFALLQQAAEVAAQQEQQQAQAGPQGAAA